MTERDTFMDDWNRHASFYDFIMETAETDPLGAAEMMVQGLMRGDRVSLKLGYGLGAALCATLEQIPLTPAKVGALVERVAIVKDGIVEYGPTR